MATNIRSRINKRATSIIMVAALIAGIVGITLLPNEGVVAINNVEDFEQKS